VQLGDGNNVVVTGNGHNSITAGNGDNLIAAGLGQHTVQVGNGSNILIDVSVTLTHSGDSLRQVLSDWISCVTNGPTNSNNPTTISNRLQVTDNTSHANTLLAGSGLDWFWETYSKEAAFAQVGGEDVQPRLLGQLEQAINPGVVIAGR
jgi:Ca2+-binding RTX toxin-like protein